MQFTLNDPIIRNFLANIPNNYHLQTIKQLILIGINMVNGALQGKARNKPQSHHAHNPPHQQCQHSYVLHQIKNIKAKIDQLSSLLVHDHNVCNQQNTQANFGMNNYHMNRNQSQKTGFIITDAQPINKKIIFHDIDEHNINIPTKELITPKITETVPYIAEQCHIQDRKNPSRRHLDDTQFKQAMVYPLSPENSKKKSKKKHHQAVNNETVVHQVFDRAQMINRNDVNVCETKPIITGQNVPKVKSKIKNLVDRDKLKHQFMGKHNSEINVEIYTKPPKKNPPPLQYSDEDSNNSIPNFKQNLKQKVRQSEADFEPYRLDENQKQKRRKSEMPRAVKKNERQEKNIKPRASQPIEVKKSKLQIQHHHQQSLHRPNQMDSYNPSVYKDYINDNSSSFSQFSLGSKNSKRQIGKISRKI